ncbi:MAG TPA: ABC transporter permease subunit [Gemmatimonadaceae bacterium]|nr:ABC transporter permease subunit [Gemmatimonadaceae bacterium]
MIRDTFTILRKEWLEFRDQLLRLRRGGLSAVVIVFLLGIVTPLQFGPDWLSSWVVMFYFPTLASSMASALIVDAVAGERERQTLESLLASRLPDSAILFGKMLAALSYGCAFVLVNAIAGCLTLNLANLDQAPLIFEPRFGALLASLTVAACLAQTGIGVFISLRATTVRQAQQTFGVIMLALFLAPALLFQLLPASQRYTIVTNVREWGLERIAMIAAVVLGSIGVFAATLAWSRFRRGKLALE